MSASPRLLMVGLDAADGDLVLRWIEEGRLPVLGAPAREPLGWLLGEEGDAEQAEIDIAARAAWDPGGAIRA